MSDGFYPIPAWALSLPSAGERPSKRGKRGGTRVSAWGVLLLGVLARYQGENETAWPSIDTLARDTGLSRRAVLEQLEALEDADAIVVERSPGRGSHYRITEPVRRGAPVRDAAPVETPEAPPATSAPVQDGAPVRGAAPVSDGARDQCAEPHHTSAPSRTTPVRRGAPEEIREEIREEIHRTKSAREVPRVTTETEPEPDAFEDARPDPRARGGLVRGYADRYLAATKHPWMSHSKVAADVDIVARWCGAHEDPLGAVAFVLDGVFSDSWMNDHRWPWGPIARDPAKYFEAGRKAAWLADRDKRRAAARREAARELDKQAAVRLEVAADPGDDYRAWIASAQRGALVQEPAPAVHDAGSPVHEEPPIVQHEAHGVQEPTELHHDIANALGRAGEHPIVVRGERTTPLAIVARMPLPALKKARDAILDRRLSEMDAVQVLTGATA